MAAACDRAADLQHAVRSRLRPRHASLFHASCDDVCAGTLDGAATDGETGGTVGVIFHSLFVVGEIIDLPLDEVTILPVLTHVTNLMQFSEKLFDFSCPEHGFLAFEMLPVLGSLFAIEFLA